MDHIAHMSGDVPHFHFHFLAKTLLEDDAGQPFPDADAALRHAEFLAVQLSEGGIWLVAQLWSPRTMR